MTFNIRPYEARDFDVVYTVCLKTGDGGSDGTHLYDDPKILGHIYAGPYVTLEPELAFVLEDEHGVCGYILGALKTEVFYTSFVNEWLPKIQGQVPNPTGKPKNWTPSEYLYHKVHHPEIDLPDALKAYPSHLHIDLLTRAQRQGNGTHLIRTLFKALKGKGSSAAHLGMDPGNTHAFKFYKKMGFHVIENVATDQTLYLGVHL